MGYLTQENLAEKLGKNQSTIANKLRLLNLDEEVQEALLNEKISERHARSLLKLSSYDDQVMLLNRIINERLTVRKTDEEINKMLNNTEETPIGNIEVLDMEEPIIIPEEEETSTIISDFNIPSTPIIETEPENTQSFETPIIDNEITIPRFNDILNDIENDSEEGEQLTPGRFFNILEEVEPEKQEEPIVSSEIQNINTDFSTIFNNVEKEENDFSISPNFGIPSFDDETFNIDLKEDSISEPIGTNTFVTGDIKTVVNTIRNCTDTIEKYGFKVESEEFDLEDMYQVIIKIQKK